MITINTDHGWLVQRMGPWKEKHHSAPFITSMFGLSLTINIHYFHIFHGAMLITIMFHLFSMLFNHQESPFISSSNNGILKVPRTVVIITIETLTSSNLFSFWYRHFDLLLLLLLWFTIVQFAILSLSQYLQYTSIYYNLVIDYHIVIVIVITGAPLSPIVFKIL